MDRHGIVEILNDIGIMLEITGESFFKSKAYYDAARTLELLEEDIGILVKEDRLKDIKGFGEALTKKVSELVITGKLEYYEKLKETKSMTQITIVLHILTIGFYCNIMR